MVEFEWVVFEMVGCNPSDEDVILANGVSNSIAFAESEAEHMLNQYANDETNVRFELFKVDRKSLGGVCRMVGA